MVEVEEQVGAAGGERILFQWFKVNKGLVFGTYAIIRSEFNRIYLVYL